MKNYILSCLLAFLGIFVTVAAFATNPAVKPFIVVEPTATGTITVTVYAGAVTGTTSADASYVVTLNSGSAITINSSSGSYSYTGLTIGTSYSISVTPWSGSNGTGTSGTAATASAYALNCYTYNGGSANVDAISSYTASGSAPALTNFTTNNQAFLFTGNTSASNWSSSSAVWTVNGTNSKIIVGDNTNITTLKIPSTNSIAGTVDVVNLSTLQVESSASTPFTPGTFWAALTAASTLTFDGGTGPSTSQNLPAGTGSNYAGLISITGSNTQVTLSGNVAVGSGGTTPTGLSVGSGAKLILNEHTLTVQKAGPCVLAGGTIDLGVGANFTCGAYSPTFAPGANVISSSTTGLDGNITFSTGSIGWFSPGINYTFNGVTNAAITASSSSTYTVGTTTSFTVLSSSVSGGTIAAGQSIYNSNGTYIGLVAGVTGTTTLTITANLSTALTGSATTLTFAYNKMFCSVAANTTTTSGGGSLSTGYGVSLTLTSATNVAVGQAIYVNSACVGVVTAVSSPSITAFLSSAIGNSIGVSFRNPPSFGTTTTSAQSTTGSGQTFTVASIAGIVVGHSIYINGGATSYGTVTAVSGSTVTATLTTAIPNGAFVDFSYTSSQGNLAATTTTTTNYTFGSSTTFTVSSISGILAGQAIFYNGNYIGAVTSTSGSVVTASLNTSVSSSSSVSFYSLDPYIGNLTIAANNTLSTPLTVTGDLTLTGGNTLADNGNIISLAGNIAYIGTGTAIHSGTGKITMTGTSKSIAGVTLGNLEIAVGVGNAISTNADFTTIGALTLTSGLLNIGTKNLTAGSIVNGSSSNYIYGTGLVTINAVPSTATLFPIGTSSSAYTPVTLTSTTGTPNITVGVGTSFSNAPLSNTSTAVNLWSIKSSVGSITASATFGYPTSITSPVLGIYTGSYTENTGSQSGSYVFTPTNAISLATSTYYYSVGAVNSFVPAAPTVSASSLGSGSASVTITSNNNNGSYTYSITPYDVSTSTVGSATSGSVGATTISGLSTTDSYHFNVTTTNTGSSTTSAITTTTPDITLGNTPPTSPTGVSATASGAGAGNLIVNFTSPSSAGSGGATLTYYTVTPYDVTTSTGGAASSHQTFTSTSATGSYTATGLTKGDNYTFTVTFYNSNSGSSNAVTSSVQCATTVPGNPTFGTISATTTTASIGVVAPSDLGGLTLGSYYYTLTNAGGTVGSANSAAASIPISLTGLTSGTSYTITVYASNANGESSGGAQTTFVTTPAAPTGISAVSSTGQATFSFTEPAVSSGVSLTYTITPTPAVSGGVTYLNGNNTTSPITVTGLTNGTAYTFTVTASDASGLGTASGSTNSVTPGSFKYSSGNVDVFGSWVSTDGSGGNPANFTATGQTFTITGVTSVTSWSGNTWTIGSGSSVTVGDGTNAATLDIPAGKSIAGTVNVQYLSTLKVESEINPPFTPGILYGTANASTLTYDGGTQQYLPAGTGTNYAGLISIIGSNTVVTMLGNVAVGSGGTTPTGLSVGSGAKLILNEHTLTVQKAGNCVLSGGTIDLGIGANLAPGNYSPTFATGSNVISSSTTGIDGNISTSTTNTGTFGVFAAPGINYIFNSATTNSKLLTSIVANTTSSGAGSGSSLAVTSISYALIGQTIYNGNTSAGTITAITPSTGVTGTLTSSASLASISSGVNINFRNPPAVGTTSTSSSAGSTGAQTFNVTSAAGIVVGQCIYDNAGTFYGTVTSISSNQITAALAAAITTNTYYNFRHPITGTFAVSTTTTGASTSLGTNATFTVTSATSIATGQYIVCNGLVVGIVTGAGSTVTATLSTAISSGATVSFYTQPSTLVAPSTTTTSTYTTGSSTTFTVNSGTGIATGQAIFYNGNYIGAVTSISSSTVTAALNTNLSNGATVSFYSSNPSLVGNVTIGATNTLNTPLTVVGTLTLSSKLNSNGNYLTANSISGGSSSNYIYGNGYVTIKSVSSSATLFPIGSTSSDYNPITFTGTTNTPNITVGVQNTFTNAPASTSNIVNLQWSVFSSAVSNSTIGFQYNSSDVTGSLSSPILGTYNTSYIETALSAISGSNPYTVTQSASAALGTAKALLYGIGNPYSFLSASAPDAPTIGSAVVNGTSSAIISFTAPANNNGSAITSYTATSSPGGITGSVNQSGSGTITVNGLTNGTSYTFTVTATNSSGTGLASLPTNAITPGIFTYTGAGNVDVLSSWADASNVSPANFTTTGQTFTITGATTVNGWSGNTWNVTSVTVGDGTNAALLDIPAGKSIVGTVNVQLLSTLQVESSVNPPFTTAGTFSTSSSVASTLTFDGGAQQYLPAGTYGGQININNANTIVTMRGAVTVGNGGTSSTGILVNNGAKLSLNGNSLTLQKSGTCVASGGTIDLGSGANFIPGLYSPTFASGSTVISSSTTGIDGNINTSNYNSVSFNLFAASGINYVFNGANTTSKLLCSIMNNTGTSVAVSSSTAIPVNSTINSFIGQSIYNGNTSVGTLSAVAPNISTLTSSSSSTITLNKNINFRNPPAVGTTSTSAQSSIGAAKTFTVTSASGIVAGQGIYDSVGKFYGTVTSISSNTITASLSVAIPNNAYFNFRHPIAAVLINGAAVTATSTATAGSSATFTVSSTSGFGIYAGQGIYNAGARIGSVTSVTTVSSVTTVTANLTANIANGSWVYFYDETATTYTQGTSTTFDVTSTTGILAGHLIVYNGLVIGTVTSITGFTVTASLSTSIPTGSIVEFYSTSSSITVGTLAINANNTLNTPLTITGTLSLSGQLNSNGNNITAGSISGGSSSNYIYGNGFVTIKAVPTTATTFPIGTSSYYLPLVLTNTTNARNITVGVGTSFTNTPLNSSNIVNAQWSVLASGAATSTITFQYNSSNITGTLSNPILGTYNGGYSESVLNSVAGTDPYTVTQSAAGILGTTTAYLYGIGNLNSFSNGTPGYYYYNTGNLDDVNSWGANIDGTGTNPLDFTTDGQVFNITKAATVNSWSSPTAVWTVSGTGSKVVVGSGSSSTILKIPAGNSIAGKVDVQTVATLQVESNAATPFTAGTFSANSSLGAALIYDGTGTQYLPTGTYSGGLTISNNNTVVLNGTVWIGGGTSSPSNASLNLSSGTTLELNSHNAIIQRSSTIVSGATVDFGTTGTIQPYNGYGLTFASGSNVITGNANGLDASLNYTNRTGTSNCFTNGVNYTFNTATANPFSVLVSATQTVGATSIGATSIVVSSATNIAAGQTIYAANGTTAIGTVASVSGTTITTSALTAALANNAYINFRSSSLTITTGNIILGANVTTNASTTSTGTLTFNAGKLTLGSNNLTIGSISGASATSYVDASGTGKLTLGLAVNGTSTYPVGTSTSYAPITVANQSATASNLTVGISSTITNAPGDPTQVANLQWSVLGSSAVNANITFQFNGTDLASGFLISSGCEVGNYQTSYVATPCAGSGIPTGANPYTVSANGFTIPTSGTNYFVVGNTGNIVVGSTSWTGAFNTSWSNPLNWTNNVPTPNVDVLIQSGGYSPVLSATQSFKNLTINSGAVLTLSSGVNLQPTVNITNNGTITGTGTLVLAGGSLQTISGTGTVGNITINNNNGVTVASGSNNLGITGVLTLQSGQLTTNGNLTFKSTSIENTGILAPYQTSGNSGTLTGNVTVERYIPPGYLGYRDMVPEVYSATNTIASTWQEGATSGAVNSAASNPHPGYGIFITGPVGTYTDASNAGAIDANGFDKSGTGGSLNSQDYTYEPTYNNPATGYGHFKAFPNTSINLDAFKGYRLLIRGDRSPNLYTTNINEVGNTAAGKLMYNATTLRATGKLITGDVTYNYDGVVNAATGVNTTTTGTAPTGTHANALNTTTNGFSMVANPYVCPVQWSAVYSTAGTSNINGSYWYLDPTSSATGKYIAYNALTGSASTATGTTYFDLNGVQQTYTGTTVLGYIQPGQAVFVQSLGATPQVIFQETAKAAGSTKAAVFGTSNLSKLYVSLLKQATSTTTYNKVDGAAVAFRSDFGNTTYGPQDALKLSGVSDNLSISDKGKNLSIDGRLPATASDAIGLKIANPTATAYQLTIDASNYSNNGFEPLLYDAYKNTTKALGTGTTTINFTVDAANAATFQNRFTILFAPSALPVNSIVATASLSNKVATISWNTVGEKNVASYEVEKSTDAKSFTTIGEVTAKNTTTANYNTTDNSVTATTYYRINAVSTTGAVSYSNITKLSIINSQLSISLYPNPLKGKTLNVEMDNVVAGKYTVSIYNALGQRVSEQTISHTGGSATHAISTSNTLAAGVYSVSITEAGSKQIVHQTSISVQP